MNLSASENSDNKTYRGGHYERNYIPKTSHSLYAISYAYYLDYKMKHKHIFTKNSHIQPFFGAKVYPNAIYGKLVSVCQKCGKIKEELEQQSQKGEE